VRARNLSCYDNPRRTTPHLDAFASECILYENAFATSSWTLPTHASLFTGLYPTQHGADDAHKYLEPKHITLAEYLNQHGYTTVAICYTPYVSAATGLDQGFSKFNPLLKTRRAHVRARIQHYGSKLLSQGDAGARLTTRQIRATLESAAKNAKPFFVFAHYAECHTPYRYPRAFQRFLPPGTARIRASRVNQNPWRQLANPGLMGTHEFESLAGLYEGALSYLDSQIASVIAALRELQLLDNTMVILTADHGENLGEHGRIGHQYCLYDTLLHIPLLIHYPRETNGGARVSKLVSSVDIVPTVLDLLGADPQEMGDLRGSSLLSNFSREQVFAEMTKPDLSPYLKLFPKADTRPHERALQTVRTFDHKLIWASDGRHELYDLRVDPEETNNLIQERPGVRAELMEQLQDWQKGLKKAVHEASAPEFDDQVRTRLRALGYLE
jgi:arylsulfatase A-like enzyme